MDFMYNLEDRLLDELKEISSKDTQGEMSAQCLDNIKDITSSLNHISTYMAMKNSGFSQDSGMNSGYSRGGQRRDRMGRYSRNSYGRVMEDDWGRDPYGTMY